MKIRCYILILVVMLFSACVVKAQAAQIDILLDSLKNATAEDSARLLNSAGTVYMQNDQYDEALSTFFDLLKLSERLNNKKGKGDAYNNIGNIYYHLGDYDHALRYYRLALKFTTGDRTGIYNNLGLIYYETDSMKKSLDYYEKALKELKKKGNELHMAIIYHNLALVYSAEKDFTKSIDNLRLALEIFRKLHKQKNMANTYNNIARAYYKQEHFNEAQVYLDSARELAQKTRSPYILMDNYKYNKQLSIREKDYENAIKYDNKYDALQDSLFNMEKEKQLAEIEARYTDEIRKIENKHLKKENAANEKIIKNQNIAVIAIIAVVILLVILLAFFYYSNLQKRKANKLLIKQKLEIEQKNKALEKAYQEISAQKEQLEKINQVKDKLFSIISHEFRSPLNSLKGALSLVQHGVISQQELADLSKDITDKINNTSIFLDNLLNWARSQMQGIEVKKQQINLNQLIKPNIELLKPQAEKKAVEILNNISDDFTIIADKDMINLIIRNLISNAIKFSLEGGKIEISAVRKNGMAEISVKDNGVGIPKENLKKLFDLDTITTVGTANEKGTGLGLMISKNFIEAQGGSIRVESREREGSVFTFTVPA